MHSNPSKFSFLFSLQNRIFIDFSFSIVIQFYTKNKELFSIRFLEWFSWFACKTNAKNILHKQHLEPLKHSRGISKADQEFCLEFHICFILCYFMFFGIFAVELIKSYVGFLIVLVGLTESLPFHDFLKMFLFILILWFL